jgi:hypothetical protein
VAMVDIITESGMDFIADNTFHIERSSLYTGLGDGVRSVEFVRVKDEKLLFVEAKKSFPNPDNPSKENFKKYLSEIDVICDKFIHSLNLFSAIKVGVAEDNCTDSLVLPKQISIAFILVVKNHKLKWCKLIKKKLIDSLPQFFVKIWKPEIFVINSGAALKHGLIREGR